MSLHFTHLPYKTRHVTSCSKSCLNLCGPSNIILNKIYLYMLVFLFEPSGLGCAVLWHVENLSCSRFWVKVIGHSFAMAKKSNAGSTTCVTTHLCGKLWLVEGRWWVYVGTPLHQPQLTTWASCGTSCATSLIRLKIVCVVCVCLSTRSGEWIFGCT